MVKDSCAQVLKRQLLLLWCGMADLVTPAYIIIISQLNQFPAKQRN